MSSSPLSWNLELRIKVHWLFSLASGSICIVSNVDSMIHQVFNLQIDTALALLFNSSLPLLSVGSCLLCLSSISFAKFIYELFLANILRVSDPECILGTWWERLIIVYLTPFVDDTRISCKWFHILGCLRPWDVRWVLIGDRLGIALISSWFKLTVVTH